jgi:DNA polymerase alpha subunit A
MQGSPAGIVSANQYTIIRQWNNIPIPGGFTEYTSQHKTSRLEMVQNERHLLNKFIALLHKLDPDVLVGHNFIGFSLDVLLHRLKANKVELQWSKLGRLRRRQYVALLFILGGQSCSRELEEWVILHSVNVWS